MDTEIIDKMTKVLEEMLETLKSQSEINKFIDIRLKRLEDKTKPASPLEVLNE